MKYPKFIPIEELLPDWPDARKEFDLAVMDRPEFNISTHAGKTVLAVRVLKDNARVMVTCPLEQRTKLNALVATAGKSFWPIMKMMALGYPSDFLADLSEVERKQLLSHVNSTLHASEMEMEQKGFGSLMDQFNHDMGLRECKPTTSPEEAIEHMAEAIGELMETAADPVASPTLPFVPIEQSVPSWPEAREALTPLLVDAVRWTGGIDAKTGYDYLELSFFTRADKEINALCPPEALPSFVKLMKEGTRAVFKVAQKLLHATLSSTKAEGKEAELAAVNENMRLLDEGLVEGGQVTMLRKFMHDIGLKSIEQS